MLPGPFAHSLPGRPLSAWEPLDKHLRDVGSGAAERAERFGWAEAARVAGRLHDIGKMSAQFQAYIQGQATRGGDHATAGAREATKAYRGALGPLLALIVAGHHGGLADPDEIERRLASELADYGGWEAHAGPLPGLAALRPTRVAPAPDYPWMDEKFSRSFLARMLFSCLVDADFVATETFVNQAPLLRGGPTDLAALRDRLRAHMQALRAGARPTALNELRAEILDHAVAKAGEQPGFFTLTVPTGGGKTLASLLFALEHAVLQGKRRVVVVIPFTAIIEQTAETCREALGADAVLEHHASFDWEQAARAREDGGDEQDGLGRLRRAAENWDAPVVVTTAVQFFESLYANRTSRCRKLHNLADSVIVLDEAQTVPPRVLLPCLAALDELQRGYGASVVLCTATQPAWRHQDGALIEVKKAGGERVNLGLHICEERELAPRPQDLYETLRRVRVEVLQEPVDDTTLADAFAQAPQMLCIVNSRAHARAVFERISRLEGAAHLTTLMCPAHRRAVLRDIRQRLHDRLPVRLVATSLIEAGVDISFPEVWRASAGLDSVAQAAGRCNREGELLPALGRVVVFTPAEARAPHALRDFQQAAASVLRDSPDPLGLDAVAQYFRLLYGQIGAGALDTTRIAGFTGVLPAIRETEGFRFPFRSIAEAFHMIEDAMPPVLVPWSEGDGDNQAREALDALAAGRGSTRDLLRRLQPYAVSIPNLPRADLLRKGALVPARTEFGDKVLRLEDAALYREATGLDLSDGAYRTAEDNLW